MDHVHINISGTEFEFSRSILDDKGDGVGVGKLAKMCDVACRAGEPLRLFVDRPAESFGEIVGYYQTGELHMPVMVCPERFLRELDFWEIDSRILADCCRYRLQSHYEEMAVRRKFLKDAFVSPKSSAGPCPGRAGHCLARLWSVVDNRESTVVAKVYFAVVFLMLLLSIGTLAYSTDKSFRRPLSKCELLEYLKHSSHHFHKSVVKVFGDPQCNTKWYLLHVYYPEYDDYDYIYEDYFNDWEVHEDDHENVSKKSNINDGVPINRSHEDADDSSEPRKKPLEVPYLTVRLFVLDVLETITIVFFTVDFIIRIVSCPSRVQYFLSIINIIDVVALIGCYVHIITLSIEKHHRYGINWIHFINYIQVLRAMRFLRVFGSVRAGKVLVYSLKSNARDFILIVLLLLFGITGFSTMFYFIEGKENIRSIPEAWYWSVVTMTTVGYGDVTPQTGFGKLLASLCSICGVLFLAISLPLFVNNFLTLYHYANVNKSAMLPTAKTILNQDKNENATNGVDCVLKRTASNVSAEAIRTDIAT